MENKIDFDSMQKAFRLFMLLSNPLPSNILEVVLKKGTISVIDIAREVNAEHAHVSGYLRRLRAADLLTYKKLGHYVYYSIKEERLQQILHHTGELLKPAA